jgi:2'-5' RNA ligase
LHRPRVIWAGVREGADDVTSLAHAVEDALAALDMPREARPCHPHLTLGRVKSPANLSRLTQLVAQLADEELGGMLVREICFIRSELLPQGAQYTVLQHIPF